MFRGLAIALIVSIVALFFTKLSISSLPIMLITIIGTSVLFSLGGFINAVFARSFDDISIVPSFILTPLTYLGGVFYSLENLSPFWQNLSLKLYVWQILTKTSSVEKIRIELFDSKIHCI